MDQKTDIEMKVPTRDNIEQLLAIGSGSFCHLDFAAPADSQRWLYNYQYHQKQVGMSEELILNLGQIIQNLFWTQK